MKKTTFLSVLLIILSFSFTAEGLKDAKQDVPFNQYYVRAKKKMNVRAAPNTSSEIMYMLEKNEDALVVEESGEWLKIKPKEGFSPWVHKDMVSNGVMLTDFQEVCASIERWDDWCAAWCKRAGVHEALGREALSEGYRLTAAEHLSRAAVYYHFAKFVFVHDLDQMRAAHMKAVACKNLALPHLQPPVRRVQIAYRGKHLAGFLRLPTGAVRPPVMLMVPGLDSAKEELEAYEIPFLQRGIATLMVDGPGQGATRRHARRTSAPSGPLAHGMSSQRKRAANGSATWYASSTTIFFSSKFKVQIFWDLRVWGALFFFS